MMPRIAPKIAPKVAPKVARADVVGSLLRPHYLLDARNAWREGRLSEAEMQKAADRAVTEAVALQESAGLDAITDGEYRRFNFMATMGVRDSRDACLCGFETVVTDAGWMRLWLNPDGSDGGLVKTETGPRSLVVDKIAPGRDAAGEEFPFLKRAARRARAKFTYPAPSMHRIAWEPENSRGSYPTARDFLLDVRDHVRAVVKQLVDLGCDYVQLDAPNYSQWHIDPRIRAAFATWGRDLDKELIEDAEIDNSVFDGITGITRGIHLWSTIHRAPAISARWRMCARIQRWCWGSSPPRTADWRTRPQSRRASGKPRPTCRWSAWRSAHSAASPPASTPRP
jgi:5-methyltetrahydropteroyltriglutamate--homocysteine methyltransferase